MLCRKLEGELNAEKEKRLKLEAAMLQLDDYFNLGNVLFQVSNRFPFCVKLIKANLPATPQTAKEGE